MKKGIGLLLTVALVSLCLTGCMPSEKKIRNAIDSINTIENCKMDMIMGIPVWGQEVDVKVKMEIDGRYQHWKGTISTTGETYEECYTDGEYKYTKNADGWEKEEIGQGSNGGSSSDSDELMFDAWVIDSIKKADDEIIVRGDVDVYFGEDELFPETVEMNYKLKMDKKCNILSADLKAKDVNSQISTFEIKIHDIGEANVDLDEVKF